MPNPTPDEAKMAKIRAAIDPITGSWFPEGEAEIHMRWLLDQLKERTDEIVELHEDLGIDKHLQAELDASQATEAELRKGWEDAEQEHHSDLKHVLDKLATAQNEIERLREAAIKYHGPSVYPKTCGMCAALAQEPKGK